MPVTVAGAPADIKARYPLHETTAALDIINCLAAVKNGKTSISAPNAAGVEKRIETAVTRATGIKSRIIAPVVAGAPSRGDSLADRAEHDAWRTECLAKKDTIVRIFLEVMDKVYATEKRGPGLEENEPGAFITMHNSGLLPFRLDQSGGIDFDITVDVPGRPSGDSTYSFMFDFPWENAQAELRGVLKTEYDVDVPDSTKV